MSISELDKLLLKSALEAALGQLQSGVDRGDFTQLEADLGAEVLQMSMDDEIRISMKGPECAVIIEHHIEGHEHPIIAGTQIFDPRQDYPRHLRELIVVVKNLFMSGMIKSTNHNFMKVLADHHKEPKVAAAAVH